MTIIEENINDQIDQLREYSINPQYISLSMNAYEYLVQSLDGRQIEKMFDLPIIVNPYQQADVVVLSDSVSEFANRDVWV